MNKQEQIEKMSKKICKSTSVGCNFPTCMKCGIKDTCKARIYATRAFETGYINGADFVEWLKKEIKEAEFLEGKKVRTKMLVDKALQEYLKGE